MSLPTSSIRHLRRTSHPLASYLRVGHRDGRLISDLLDTGLPAGAGVIVDPAAEERTSELRHIARMHAREIILDTRSVELATLGGWNSTTASRLDWAPKSAPHTANSLTGDEGQRLVRGIVEAAITQGATAVLSPTHFLDSDFAWIAVDAELTSSLRTQLDDAGATATAIYYPLVASAKWLRRDGMLTQTMQFLQGLIADESVDAVFLRIHGFGTRQAGPRNLRAYVRLARQLHDLGVPLVAERTGTVGVALAAFGAVGGVESSVTHGESCDIRRLMRPSTGRPFVPPPRVYLTDALAMVSRSEAESLLARRGFAGLRCQDLCCHRDRDGMVSDPRRHFVVTRSRELLRMSNVPAPDRGDHYVRSVLLPAVNQSARLARVDETYGRHRDRLLAWSEALDRTLEEDAAKTTQSTSGVPTGHRYRVGA